MRPFALPLTTATLCLAAVPALADDDNYGAYLFQGTCNAFSTDAVVEDVGDLDVEDDADDVAEDWARLSPDGVAPPSPVRMEDETVDDLTPDRLAAGGYAVAVTQADSRDAALIACGEVPQGAALPFVGDLREVNGSGVAGRMAAEAHEGDVRFTVAAYAKDAAPVLGNIAAPALAMAGETTLLAANYACADSEVLRVVYVNGADGRSFAILLQMDEMITLGQEVSASGAIYTATSPDHAYTLLTKGEEASLEDGEGNVILSDCSM